MADKVVSGLDLEELCSGGVTDLHSHTTTGLNLAHDGDKMEITKLTIVNGLITELEFNI